VVTKSNVVVALVAYQAATNRIVGVDISGIGVTVLTRIKRKTLLCQPQTLHYRAQIRLFIIARDNKLAVNISFIIARSASAARG